MFRIRTEYTIEITEICQFYFNSIKMGHNNNRWRGIRKWPNGDIWALQAHHINQLLVDENTPIRQGTHYAVAAGELLGSHAHTHFVFKTNTGGKEKACMKIELLILKENLRCISKYKSFQNNTKF